MAKFKVNRTKDYTVMSNHHLKNKKLSLKSKGLLSMMLSLPEDWNYSISGLEAICKEGATSLRAAMKELEKEGYLVIDKVKNSRGLFEYIYNIYEEPNDNAIKLVDPDIYNPDIENLHLENLDIENMGLYKILNNKELNNKIFNNKILINQSIYHYTVEDIKRDIEYDLFKEIDRKIVNELVDIIVEVLNSREDTIKIGSSKVNSKEAKERFKMIKFDHITYVLECLQANTSKVMNIKSYLTTCLYNSTYTINSYYQQKVNNEFGVD